MNGRDLTANDVDDALHIDCPTNEQIAERLNRIARPSGGYTLDDRGRRVDDWKVDER